MVTITIGKNEGNQRVDRFLKKYLKHAPLSRLYRIIRKDLKVNGRRAEGGTLLREGDVLTLYLDETVLAGWAGAGEKERPPARRQFRIAYEDPAVLIVEKPFGLLTHGDRTEKKNTLANQVTAYLTETGAYIPRMEKTFAPAPVNRLDRNTTGLVMFGKTAPALQSLNRMLREKGFVRKYYWTIVAGELETPLILKGRMEKDRRENRVRVMAEENETGKLMETVATPLFVKDGFTFVEAELVTGRTHQIRAHLASAGYPVLGDAKYGNPRINRKAAARWGLTTQFLHARRLFFEQAPDPIGALAGKEIIAPLPEFLKEIREDLLGNFRDPDFPSDNKGDRARSRKNPETGPEEK